MFEEYRKFIELWKSTVNYFLLQLYIGPKEIDTKTYVDKKEYYQNLGKFDTFDEAHRAYDEYLFTHPNAEIRIISE